MPGIGMMTCEHLGVGLVCVRLYCLACVLALVVTKHMVSSAS